MADDFILGACYGFLLGALVYSGPATEIKQPTQIVYEDRNGDGLQDLVQKFTDSNEEIVLYATRTLEGIEYKVE